MIVELCWTISCSVALNESFASFSTVVLVTINSVDISDLFSSPAWDTVSVDGIIVNEDVVAFIVGIDFEMHTFD